MSLKIKLFFNIISHHRFEEKLPIFATMLCVWLSFLILFYSIQILNGTMPDDMPPRGVVSRIYNVIEPNTSIYTLVLLTIRFLCHIKLRFD